MLATSLLTRALNQTSHEELARAQRERLVHALQYAPYVHFDSSSSMSSSAAPLLRQREASDASSGSAAGSAVGGGVNVAHKAGVNALTVDKFEGRYLLSGGADASLAIWDLESPANTISTGGDAEAAPTATCTYTPLGTTTKANKASHRYGITHVSFYPFDSLAFLSSSYDHTLKIFSSETLAPSASFDMSSVVYSHAMSPIASHLLVACASQHPGIRLVDLRSGASTHALTGHVGSGVLSVAWSPRHENMLMSGGADGTVRFWDVRRSAGMLGSLDKEDSVGGGGQRDGKAHDGTVNGVMWTNNGKHIVTVGHDERVRIWDASSGANTLANFGPLIRNKLSSTLLPCLSPSGAMPAKQDVLLFPNERDISMFDLLEGRLIKRLRVPRVSTGPVQRSNSSKSNLRHRTTALAWRYHDVEIFSAHTDGSIRSWRPRTTIDAMVDEQDRAEADGREDSDGRKRKRQILEDIYKDLMAPKLTYS